MNKKGDDTLFNVLCFCIDYNIFFFRAGTSLQNKGQANVVLRCVERLLKNNVTKVRKWLKLLKFVFSLEILILAFSVHSFLEYLNF